MLLIIFVNVIKHYMSRKKFPKFNWNSFFQNINSTTGRITIISTLLGIGFGFGSFTYKTVSDRELLQQERELNDCHYSLKDIESSKKDLEKNLEFEINKLKYENRLLKDSISKNYGKK